MGYHTATLPNLPSTATPLQDHKQRGEGRATQRSPMKESGVCHHRLLRRQQSCCTPSVDRCEVSESRPQPLRLFFLYSSKTRSRDGLISSFILFFFVSKVVHGLKASLRGSRLIASFTLEEILYHCFWWLFTSFAVISKENSCLLSFKKKKKHFWVKLGISR